MTEAKDVTTTSFGLVIAYLLPGLAGLISLTFWSASIKELFRAFLTSQSSIGLFLIVVIASLIIGLEIGIIRWFIFEYILCRRVFLTAEDYALLQSDAKMNSFRILIDEIYRHSQFFGGMAIVIPFLYLGWSKNAYSSLGRDVFVLVTASVVVMEALTVVATKVSYERFVNRARLMLKGESMSNGVPSPKISSLKHGEDDNAQRPANIEELSQRDQPPPIAAGPPLKGGEEVGKENVK